MPESKRELANKELKETDFVTLSQESQDETPLMLQGLEDENQNCLEKHPYAYTCNFVRNE